MTDHLSTSNQGSSGNRPSRGCCCHHTMPNKQKPKGRGTTGESARGKRGKKDKAENGKQARAQASLHNGSSLFCRGRVNAFTSPWGHSAPGPQPHPSSIRVHSAANLCRLLMSLTSLAPRSMSCIRNMLPASGNNSLLLPCPCRPKLGGRERERAERDLEGLANLPWATDEYFQTPYLSKRLCRAADILRISKFAS